MHTGGRAGTTRRIETPGMTDAVRGKGLRALILIAFLIAAARCEKTPQLPGAPVVKKVRANVMTVRTSIEPSKRTSTHTIVIGESLARSTAEAPVWHLYDFRQDRVTTVDDLAKTYRVESVSSLVAARQRRFRAAAEELLPEATARATGVSRPVLGLAASQIVISAGAYQRQLWFAPHPKVPPQLFAMMHASGEVEPSQAMRQVDDFLVSARGFPLADHTEIPYGTATIVIDRVVESVLPRDVPASLLVLPPGYRDVTVTAPAARRPAASSRPRGRTTPAAGSQSSSTTQTVP